MNERLIGYCRVSSREQNEHRQVIAMQKFGVSESDILVEKVSGKDFNRPVYQEMVKSLKPGDTVVVDSLDRLGRDRDAVIDEWRRITKECGADIVVLDMFPLLDTRQRDSRDFTATFVADLVLQILSYLSEKERLLNRERQQAGIAAAKERGVKFGGQPKERPAILDELHEKWQRGEITSRDAGRLLGISHSTFLRWIKGE
jgi:DNA invertase Pin-like site-specific DNA recombinase